MRILARPSGRPARCAAMALLSVLLGGCFVSEQAKFPLSSAAPAFGDGGRYQSLVREGDHYKQDAILTLHHRADGAYDMIDEKNVSAPISFYSIGSDLYVAQGKTEESRHSFHYIVARIARGGAEALLYAPECKAQDKAKLQSFGVEVRDEECVIDRVADPVGLFATRALGEPTSKLVRQ